MPYTTSYVDEGRGVHKRASAIVTGPEILSSAREGSLDEERTKKLLYGLIDFSDIEAMHVTPEEVRLIVEWDRRTAAFAPGAIVALIATDPLAYGMLRFWQSFSDDLGLKAKVFHTKAEAVGWLTTELTSKIGSSIDMDQFPFLQTY